MSRDRVILSALRATVVLSRLGVAAFLSLALGRRAGWNHFKHRQPKHIVDQNDRTLSPSPVNNHARLKPALSSAHGDTNG